MGKREQSIATSAEPKRDWKKPVLREEDYSKTESAPTSAGTSDLSFYS